MSLGTATVLLGGGRQLAGDKIDPAVGIKLIRTKGDQVRVYCHKDETQYNGGDQSKLSVYIKIKDG